MELEARVEQISETIRELRQNAGDGRTTRQLVDSLFRAVHSLKAAASTAGLNEVARVAHEFEDLLHALRTGKLRLDAEVLKALDDTTAALRDGAETSLAHRLKELTYTETHPEAISDEKLRDLKDDERYRAVQAMRDGSKLFVMEAVFEVVDFDRRFRQLKEQLEGIAEVISTSAAMDEDKINFRILYAAQSEKIRVKSILERAVRAGTSLAEQLAKQVNFVVRAGDFLLDESVSNVLADSLLHLVRNAVDHGIESHGTITLEATTTRDHARITVTDNGRGIDAANLPLVFQPGFSTATEVTELSGRGVGLDAVKSAVEQLGGTVTFTSEPGRGASFEITMRNPSSDA